jgi:hypothetical protein
MIGAYFGTETVSTAVDGATSGAPLDSFAKSGAACQVIVPISFDVTAVADSLARLQQLGLAVQSFHDAAAFSTAGLSLSGTALFVELEEPRELWWLTEWRVVKCF